MPTSPAQTRQNFLNAVNMDAAELHAWLQTDTSKSTGWANGAPKTKPEGPESVGHASGRRIVELLTKSTNQLTESDYKHMRKVVGFIHRHVVQRPLKDITHTRWRYSLMNWGHDPLKYDFEDEPSL